jgi:TPR repeat protein
VLSKPTANSSALEQLKRALTVKADAGDVKAQRALAGLYQSGSLAPDGSAQHDYAGAAYWYHQASVHGDAQASYELAILYRNGLGVPADAAQSFQLLEKAAEANYVPAMPLLSDAYASQKTPVSGQRATYWATTAAEAGDPRGWMILGFEYNVGKLGGDQVTWYPRALAAYRKAAAGGNCVAMMAIGDLYASGQGVPTDQAQAQSWHAKAQSCQGGNIAMLQAQVAQYKAKAAAARDPALYPMFSAIPIMPNSGAVAAGNGNRSGPAVNSKIVAGLVAGAVIAAAIMALTPPRGNANSGSDDPVGDNLNSIMQANQRSQALTNCNLAGGTFVAGTGCN